MSVTHPFSLRLKFLKNPSILSNSPIELYFIKYNKSSVIFIKNFVIGLLENLLSITQYLEISCIIV